MTPNVQQIIDLFNALEPSEQVQVVARLATTKPAILKKGLNFGPSPLRDLEDMDTGRPYSGLPLGPAPTNRMNVRPRVCPTCGRPT